MTICFIIFYVPEILHKMLINKPKNNHIGIKKMFHKSQNDNIKETFEEEMLIGSMNYQQSNLRV